MNCNLRVKCSRCHRFTMCAHSIGPVCGRIINNSRICGGLPASGMSILEVKDGQAKGAKA